MERLLWKSHVLNISNHRLFYRSGMLPHPAGTAPLSYRSCHVPSSNECQSSPLQRNNGLYKYKSWHSMQTVMKACMKMLGDLNQTSSDSHRDGQMNTCFGTNFVGKEVKKILIEFRSIYFVTVTYLLHHQRFIRMKVHILAQNP